MSWLPRSLVHFVIFALFTITTIDVKYYVAHQFICFGIQASLADEIWN